MAISVHEVTRIRPDLLRVEVRDGPVGKVGITAVASPPDARATNEWHAQSGSHILVAGQNKEYSKWSDDRDGNYVNRAVSGTAGSYGAIGGRTVTAVGRKVTPYDSGQVYGDVGYLTAKACAMKHYLYLQLDDDLAPGSHTISFPANMSINADTDVTSNLADCAFSFTDKSIRCAAIKTNQLGYAPTDRIKYAYLSEWAPELGTEGRIDFSDITNWYIIDRNGRVVWDAGAAPVLRVAYNTAEPSAGISAAHDARIMATTNMRTLVGYTDANPCVMTYTGPDFANDDAIKFSDVRSTVSGADSQTTLNSGYHTVASGTIFEWIVKNVDNTNPSAKTAELWYKPENTGGPLSGTAVALDLSAGTRTYRSGGKINNVVAVNRDATNVYGLDFTSFEPEDEGLYAIYIPGHGRSHWFSVDHGVWYRQAEHHAKGEYNHRHQIDIDGRFGFTRPAGFSQANNQIYECLLPYSFSNEVGIAMSSGSPHYNSAHIYVAGQTTSPCFTDTLYTGPIPGHHDAGDHDSRIGSHEIAYYGYMDFYDQFPTQAGLTDWNIPTILECYPSESSRYAGTNILPECLHQAMFGLHGYIATINEDGFARGGVNNSLDNSLVPSWMKNSGDTQLSATTHTIFVYGPCELATWTLGKLCAKMAVCLRKWDTLHSTTTFATLAQWYEDNATTCWDAAEAAWNNGTRPNAVTDALYGDYEAACTTLGASTEFDARLADLDAAYTTRSGRMAFASAMYRMTGDSAYSDIVVNYAGNPGTDDLRWQMAKYEYCLATHGNVDTSKQASFKSALYSIANSMVTYNTSTCGYKCFKFPGLGMRFGFDGTDWATYIGPTLYALILKERESAGSGAAYRKCLEDGFAYINGANALGLSMVVGLGTDYAKNVLNNDAMATGQDVPIGGVTYGPTYRYPIQGDSNGGGSPGLWMTEHSSEYDGDHELFRQTYPHRSSFPSHEYYFEVPGQIEMTEYVFAGSIAPQQWAAAVLWALDGVNEITLDTDVPAGRVRGNAVTS